MTSDRSPKALIFDLDGTLADTLLDIMDAMNFALSARGLPTHDAAHYRRVVGGGARNLASLLLPPGKRELVTEVTREFRARYAQYPIARSRPYPGVAELLAQLVADGRGLAVLSNKPDHLTRPIVAALFPEVPFVRVVGERPEYPRKPDPAVALELSRQLGAPPEQCILIGDTSVDMRTARAAGMLPVGVRWGFHDPSELQASGARYLLSRPAELLEVLRAQTCD